MRGGWVFDVKKWSLGLLLLGVAMFGRAESFRLPDGEVLADPTRPMGWRADGVMVSGAPSRPAISVDSILYSSSRKVATINGVALAEGQQTGSVRVVKIEARRVLLDWRGQRWYESVQGASQDALTIRR
ncbi:general secretion pathway protein GspB [Hahella sp. HN01]|nr:general secretion pathway protein GspB [Hahella sp. HN01]MBU6952860.1 general secretion pathway protein GspB [Hahella sp. HN01]